MFLANAFWTTQQWIINQQPVSKQINTRNVLFELPAYLISRLNSTPSEKKESDRRIMLYSRQPCRTASPAVCLTTTCQQELR